MPDLSNSSGTWTVYQAVNLANRKRYIGVTKRKLSERVRQHVRAAESGKSGLFMSAMRKHGPDKFIFYTLEMFSNAEDATLGERRLISSASPEYNLTSGGEGTPGFKLSAEAKGRRSGRPSPLRGRPRPKEVVERVAAKLRGRKRKISPEYRETLVAAAARMRAAPRGPNSEKQRVAARALAERNREPVVCLNDNKSFGSLTEAGKFYDINLAYISAVARGEQDTTSGLAFAFANSDRRAIAEKRRSDRRNDARTRPKRVRGHPKGWKHSAKSKVKMSVSQKARVEKGGKEARYFGINLSSPVRA
jgi:group I intron endonuclease